MRVLAVANQKGGCGKTTTSINFAACLAYLQKKILLIDLDPQGHSTCGLGIDPAKKLFTLYDFLCPRRETRPVFFEGLCEISPGFYLIPSDGRLNALEEELSRFEDRDKRLKLFLLDAGASDAEFDYVILDCPPNLGVLTYNALEAADEVLIPVEPSFFSLHGLAKISETLERVSARRASPLEIHALLTLFDSRVSFSEEVYEEVRTHFKDRLFSTIIHQSIVLKEAASAGKSIVEYDPRSAAFRDYFHLAVEYLEREWDRLLPARDLGWDQVLRSRYGPRRVPGGVLFQVLNREARAVEIAGDFNQWIPEPLVHRDEDGLWQKILAVPPGRYHYKLIVDGEWQVDPDHPDQRVNAFGTLDSYLELV